jgi:flagellar hook-basal body complex protein FliE
MLPILNAATAAASSFSLSAAASTGAASSSAATASAPFADLMTDAVSQVSHLEDAATTAMTGLISGTGVDVHQAMIATEKASMSFELALAVRNKAVQAYQSVMGMQF